MWASEKLIICRCSKAWGSWDAHQVDSFFCRIHFRFYFFVSTCFFLFSNSLHHFEVNSGWRYQFSILLTFLAGWLERNDQMNLPKITRAFFDLFFTCFLMRSVSLCYFPPFAAFAALSIDENWSIKSKVRKLFQARVMMSVPRCSMSSGKAIVECNEETRLADSWWRS